MAKKILVVDDEADLVKAIEIRLKAKGYEVLTAFDGEEALTMARRESPDLIILDIMLPKINGFKVCRLLKFDEKYQKIPVIMLTARTEEGDKTLGKETGANEYLTKPFEWEDLIGKVEVSIGEG